MNYHNITKDDMKNGSGLRAVLWVSGCNHNCIDCQNPITWDPEGGLLFDDKAKQELFELLDRDYISGLTLSGGDPLFPGNRETITDLCKKVNDSYPDKDIWLYTGYKWEDICSLDIVKYIDVCVDGPYEAILRDVKLKWRGSSNQRVIDVKETLLNKEIVFLCD